mgnify:CR=1 FL=1
MKYVTFIGRLLFGAIFLLTAYGHFMPETINYAASKGIPLAAVAVPLSGVMEIIGALSIVIGYKANWGAWLIVLFLIPISLGMHSFWTIEDPIARYGDMVHFLKNISMLGGALILTQVEPGSISLDRILNTERANA